jgi:hypothetical protein
MTVLLDCALIMQGTANSVSSRWQSAACFPRHPARAKIGAARQAQVKLTSLNPALKLLSLDW